MAVEVEENITFAQLGLTPEVMRGLDAVGYESPSSIQAQTIPAMMAGRDLVGQAQTGTGKTAAFALPLLSTIDIKRTEPQVLVLVPTRELAIQVSEAFQRYAAFIPGFHVLPVYGGQGYEPQLRQLKRGTHVVVGTPGRLADHLKKRTLKLDALKCLVIDEADEMLRMGFIDEVEWIIQQTPDTRQIALFSATMPEAIRRIANGYLKDPATITIREKTATAASIRQRYWVVSGLHKLDALTRILEGEPFDAALVFVRTKTATFELADKLTARGFAAAPLSGDLAQKEREATVDKLKEGELDILVATDVAARGLDVSRISHVFNYDIPYDTESYIHRIGRTGRAGRPGDAILFAAPRERRLLQAIERATRQRIEPMKLPSASTINDIRITRFKERIAETLAVEELGFYYQLIEGFVTEKNVSAVEVAAALAKLLQGDEPFLLATPPEPPPFQRDGPPSSPYTKGGVIQRQERSDAPPRVRFESPQGGVRAAYRIDVGRVHGVKPGQIVGAIANEAGLTGGDIGNIAIFDTFSLVDLPAGLPPEILDTLKKTRVCGRPLKAALDTGRPPARKRPD